MIADYFGKTSFSLHKCSELCKTYVLPRICMKLMTFSEMSMTDFAKSLFPKTYKITTPLKAIDQSEFTVTEIWNYVTVPNIIVTRSKIKINTTVILLVLYGRESCFLTFR